MFNIKKYNTIFIDSDGVLLDSNEVKSQAFYDAVIGYGEENAQKLYEYNKTYMGISRFKKMEIFLKDIVGKPYTQEEVNDLIEKFGDIVTNGILASEETPDMRDFLTFANSISGCYLITGGAEEETKSIYEQRNLSGFFKGIFGSPKTKEEILQDILNNTSPPPPYLFIGDSKYDYESATAFNIDFIFMTQFTDFYDYSSFFADKNIKIIYNLSDLLNEKS